MMKRAQPLILLVAALAACGGDLNESAEIDSAAGEAAVIPDTGTTAANTLITTLSEWKVDAPVDSVAPGSYTFIAQNTGRLTHALEVEGSDDEKETTPIPPGQRGEVTLDLKPGVYELYCPIEDSNGKHEALGMKRTLVVRATS